MSLTFTKLFSSITESTIWVEPYATRIVWVSMLAMADRKGRVWASVPGLAKRAGVTMDEAEAALERFMSPDRHSRTPDNEGRRIEPIDGGWRLLNYLKYREQRDDDARKEYMRDYMRDRRKQEKLTVAISKPPLAQAEAEEEEDKTLNTVVGASAPTSPQVVETLPLRSGKPFAVTADFIAELEPLYPAVDVTTTVREMKAWLVTNPDRRKTQRGIRRFVGRWLQSEQEKYGGQKVNS